MRVLLPHTLAVLLSDTPQLITIYLLAQFRPEQSSIHVTNISRFMLGRVTEKYVGGISPEKREEGITGRYSD